MEPRASGLSRQCSATKLQHPPIFLSLCRFKGLRTVTAQIISYWSLDLGEPRLSGSLCCDEAKILSKSQTHTAIITYQDSPILYGDGGVGLSTDLVLYVVTLLDQII